MSLPFPPGPEPITNPFDLLNFVNQYQRDPLGFADALFTRYGDSVRLQLGNYQTILLSHPEHIHEVLVTQAERFIKGPDYKNNSTALARMLGDGPLSAEGELWEMQNHAIRPMMHGRYMEQHFDVIREIVDNEIKLWNTDCPMNVSEIFQKFGLQVVTRTLFNLTIPKNELAGFSEAVGVINEVAGSFDPLPFWLPTIRHLRERYARHVIDRLLYRVIEERRNSVTCPHDMLTALFYCRSLTTVQLRDALATLLIAGHETTASALTWACYLLASYPDVQKRLHAEVDEVFRDSVPTLAKLADLKFTQLVIKEAMRLYPPAFAFARQPIEATEIGDFTLPKACDVTIFLWRMHRDPRWWPRPDQFIPERFSDGSQLRLHRHAYLPFGAGTRMCIGTHFALMEATVMLVLLAQQFTLSLDYAEPVIPEPLVTMRVKNGLKLNLSKRSK